MPDLKTRRILVTQSNDFMGPAICAFLKAQGAEIVADASVLRSPEAARKTVENAGAIDAMVVNLALPAPSTRPSGARPSRSWSTPCPGLCGRRFPA